MEKKGLTNCGCNLTGSQERKNWRKVFASVKESGVEGMEGWEKVRNHNQDQCSMIKPSFTAILSHRAFSNVKILKYSEKCIATSQVLWYLLCCHLSSCSSSNWGSSNCWLQSSPGHVDRHLILDHSEILALIPILQGCNVVVTQFYFVKKVSYPFMIKVCTTQWRFLFMEASQKHRITFQGTESVRIPRIKIITCSLFL